MNKLMLSSFVLGAIQATGLEVEDKKDFISYDDMFAGITAEIADHTNQDLEEVEDILQNHPLGLQDTSELNLGENKCAWTVKPLPKPRVREYIGYIKQKNCRVMKIPNSPFPRGLGCSGRRAWARKPENKAKWIAYVKAYKENLKEAKQYKWVDRAQCNKLKGIYSCHMIVP